MTVSLAFPNTVVGQLVAILAAWSVAGLLATPIGLYRSAAEFWRNFWWMTGSWALIDGLIAIYAAFAPKQPLPELATILGVNAGLDIVYIGVGLILLRQSATRPRGFGAAILTQGIFLLGLDLVFWWKCQNTLA